MTNGLGVIVMEDGDTEQDAVAGHGGGEDVAVIEIDEGVECAAGDGEENGGGKRADGAVFDVGRFRQAGWLGCRA